MKDIEENSTAQMSMQAGWKSIFINHKIATLAVAITAVSISLFQLYTSAFGVMPAYQQRMVHMTAEMILAFLLYNAKRKKQKDHLSIFGYIIPVLLLSILIYTMANYSSIVWRVGNPQTIDVIIGLVYLVLVLEATRRTVGYPLVIIAAVFIVYCFLGPYIPGIFGHRGVTIARLADHMYMATEGIFGSPIGVSATYIFIFVLFGSFLEITHGGDLFIDLALCATGRGVGGPAKAAVVSSALMGTISGSSIGNVVATGTFTIPLMKKVGYSKEFAGAVEAASSTGGQIMPPVMGAAAFLMIDYIRKPYTDIIMSALLPAILYFVGVYISVHLEAKRLELKGIPDEDMPKIKLIMRERGHLLIPLIVMIYMLVRGRTPMMAAVWSIVSLLVLAMAIPTTRFNLKLTLSALKTAAIGMVPVAMACATAGIVSGAISITGVGLKLASFIEIIANGNLMIALILTMVTSLILGMGLPTTATYIVLITIVGPALTNMGVPILAAHMFVFYYGVVADITPPVALAAYAASGIAGGNTFKTGLKATGIAMGGFVLPYIFVYAPKLLVDIHGGVWQGFAAAMPMFIISLIALYMFSAGSIGFLKTHCRWYDRVLLLLGSILIIMQNMLTIWIGIGCLILVYLIQILRGKREISNENRSIT